jgi:protein-S-isoprenylcysteine O-methyltransferase Ste14
MYKNKHIISIGNFLFKNRNYLFPLAIVLLFVIVPPKNTFLGYHRAEDIKDWLALGVCLVGLGIRMSVIGFAYIKRGGLNKKVYADNLVKTGIFAICRNPLYVGNVIIYSGIFLMHGNLWVILTGTLTFTFIYICLIAAEENFLRTKFGTEFDQYCAETPRWIPRLKSLRSSVEGMEFDYKKVILKDYTTVFNTLFALIMIEIYENFANPGEDRSEVINYSFVIVIMVIMMTMIKLYKKKEAAQNNIIQQ